MLLLLLDLDKPVLNVSPAKPKDGENVVFTCNVNNTDEITSYEWYYNGNNISDETNRNYSLTNGDRTNSGYYFCNVTSKNFERSSEKITVTYLCKYTFLLLYF